MDDFYFELDQEIDLELGQMLGDNRPAMKARAAQRFNPMDLPEWEFFMRYRFQKSTVRDHLVPLLYPNGRAIDGRGFPFTPTQVLNS